ncbi:EAL domain-containing protein [Sphingomonas elodea]|uniref:EAL domain-containing protein n=2 Tax=Pseudomonadota TaxID=1224 RepID=UPI0002630AFD|nr:EAL domain-containing protein [Sphingomonas elodea]
MMMGAKMRIGGFWRRFDRGLNVSVGLVRAAPPGAGQSVNPAWAALVVAVRIDNLDLIRIAFGSAAEVEVSSAVWRALQNRLASSSAVVGECIEKSQDEFLFVVRAATEVGAGSHDFLRRQVGSWLLELGCQPISGPGSEMHVALSWSSVDAGPRCDDKDVLHHLVIEARNLLPHMRDGSVPQFSRPEWVRRDMMVAAGHYAALALGELQFAWEPVRAIDDDALLYMRAVAAVPGVVGEVIDREAGYRALERLRLVAAFDQSQVWLAIDHVARGGGRAVCVPVSAISFRRSAWWDGVMSRLAAQRALAERLLIAIDCNQFALSPGSAAELADQLRRLGCKIVLHGFGGGQVAFAGLLALRPDVIMLDPFLIRLAGRGGRDFALFRQVVALASVLAPVVAAEGLDTAAHAELALDAGVAWACGGYAGLPTWRGPEAHAGRPARIPPFQWSDVAAEWVG